MGAPLKGIDVKLGRTQAVVVHKELHRYSDHIHLPMLILQFFIYVDNTLITAWIQQEA